MVAARIGVRDPRNAVLIYLWANGTRPVPLDRCVQIEVATGGVVRRWDLRPDDWSAHWPELVGVDGAPPAPSRVLA
jgi:DNA-binding transcriptional regulator YdaS (Cro superfamily)